jgi:hypothetical protein
MILRHIKGCHRAAAAVGFLLFMALYNAACVGVKFRTILKSAG